MSLTHSCCLWELSVSVSVERWAVITSNAQAGIKTGAGGEQHCCCRRCSAVVMVSLSPPLSHLVEQPGRGWVGDGVSRQGLNSSGAPPPGPDEVCDLDLYLEKGISEMWGLSLSLLLCLCLSVMGKQTISTVCVSHMRLCLCHAVETLQHHTLHNAANEMWATFYLKESEINKRRFLKMRIYSYFLENKIRCSIFIFISQMTDVYL